MMHTIKSACVENKNEPDLETLDTSIGAHRNFSKSSKRGSMI